MNKRAGLIIFVIISLIFPCRSLADGLHFGIISAVESKINELKAKKYEVKRSFTDTTGHTTIHSDLLDEDIHIVTQSADTGQPISGITVNFYTNKVVVIISAVDPEKRYFPTPYLTSLSQSASEIQPAQMSQTSSGIWDIVLELPSVIGDIYDFGKKFYLLTYEEIARLPGTVYLGAASFADIEIVLTEAGTLLVMYSPAPPYGQIIGVVAVSTAVGIETAGLFGADIHKPFDWYWIPYLGIVFFLPREEPIPGVSIDVETKYWEETPDWPGGKYQLRITVQAPPGDVSSITISGPCIDTVTYPYSGGQQIFILDTKEPPRVGQSITFQIKYADGSSETTSKTIDRVFTETPTLLSPPNGSTINTLTPTFEWRNLSISGLSYSVQVDDTNHNRVYSKYDLPDGTTIHRIPSGYLNWGTTYYWLVSANDANGNSALAAWDTFTTAGS